MTEASPRYVIDTNVLFSAVLFKASTPSHVVRQVVIAKQLLVSLPVPAEYREVLSRPYILKRIGARDADNLLKAILEASIEIRVTTSTTDCRDPKDNKFLELALDGNADAIISGDEDLLVLHPWRGIDILTPANFLTMHARR